MPRQPHTVTRLPLPAAATALTVLAGLMAMPLQASAQLTLSTELSLDPASLATAQVPQADLSDRTELRASTQLSGLPTTQWSLQTDTSTTSPAPSLAARATEAQRYTAEPRPTAWQRLGNSLHGLWSRVQDHLTWPFAGTDTASAEAPLDARSALLADLSLRRSLRGGVSGLMLYSQEAAEIGRAHV